MRTRMGTSAESFTCSICGGRHEGLPLDTAYRLPDEVHALPDEERHARAEWSSELCELGRRRFIRCLLPVPFERGGRPFGWGVWVEVPRRVFERYLELYHEDATAEPEVPGRLANELASYPRARGLPVLVRFGTGERRPTVRLAPELEHPLARDQAYGMDERRYHAILAAAGALSAGGRPR